MGERNRPTTITAVAMVVALGLCVPAPSVSAAEEPAPSSAGEAPDAPGAVDADEPAGLARSLLRFVVRITAGLGSSAAGTPIPSSPTGETIERAPAADPPAPATTSPLSDAPEPDAPRPAADAPPSTVPISRSAEAPERPSERASADQAEAFALINGSRQDGGLAPLQWDDTLGAKAQAWAEEMAGAGRIYHSTLMEGAPPGWRLLGENVGYGGSVARVHEGYLGSPGHRANIENDRFTHAATGVARSGGRVYTAQVFMQR